MQREIPDPRSHILSKISLENCRVVQSPHIVFVCGGKVDLKSTENLSVRNMFMNKSGSKTNIEFILAENIVDWKDGYSDLAEIEGDIAGISSVVAVILESAGSLAELGLFYANPDIRSKLFAILHREYYKEDSFIKLGLLKPLEELDQRFVLSFDIDSGKIEDVEHSVVEEIVEEVALYCNNLPTTMSFNKGDNGHVLFLIFQMLELLLVLTISEIYRNLKTLGFEISASRLKSCIFILSKFGMVDSERRSSQTFYFAKRKGLVRVEFRYKSGTEKFDTKAIKIRISQYYREAATQDRSEANRLNVIKMLQSTGGI